MKKEETELKIVPMTEYKMKNENVYEEVNVPTKVSEEEKKEVKAAIAEMVKEKVVIENKYVFICFPPDGEDNENKRLLGKLEELFPTYEFVFGNPLLWKREAEYLLNTKKAVEIGKVVQDEVNRKRALETAKLFEAYIKKYENSQFLTEGSFKHFFYWELKQIINESSEKKISNKETKELLDYLKLYNFVKEYEVEGKKRYCLTITGEDERDFLETKMCLLDDKITNLKNQKENLEKEVLKFYPQTDFPDIEKAQEGPF